MYGGVPYAGGPYAGEMMEAADVPVDTEPMLAVEVAFTTDALDPNPAFVDVTQDVRRWDVQRGRMRELERFPAGRATVVLSNFDRQYDAVNTAGPWFGNIRPNRRIRIRETFSGVTYPTFDGYIDRWQLDYPDKGKDAIATITATDGFKFLSRTDLPVSVYHDVVLTDAPEVYWRLDETKNSEEDSALTALNLGTLATLADGAYVGPPQLGGERLVVNDPGSSMIMASSASAPGTEDMGVSTEAAVFNIIPAADAAFALECWCIPETEPGANATLFTQYDDTHTVRVHVYYTLSNHFVMNVFQSGTSYDVSTSPTTFATHKRYHIVAKVVADETVKLWINGQLFEGEVSDGNWAAPGEFVVGHIEGSPSLNWVGPISHVAIWRGAAVTLVNQTWVDRHYEAGTHPWQGDTPKVRLGRVLDFANWPAALRELDTGDVTLQSASFGG